LKSISEQGTRSFDLRSKYLLQISYIVNPCSLFIESRRDDNFVDDQSDLKHELRRSGTNKIDNCVSREYKKPSFNYRMAFLL